MNRQTIQPRRAWQSRVEADGLIYHTPNGNPYWDESAFYEFTADEVDLLEAATEELQQLYLKAGQHVIDGNRFSELAIPPEAVEMIKSTWLDEPPSIYGRFDLAYNGKDKPKLLEYNADTPTALLEASVIQWNWLEDQFAGRYDQFNSIHDKLIVKWKDIKPYLRPGPLYFAHLEDFEDGANATYLRDTAEQAEIKTAALTIDEVGWNEQGSSFRDLQDLPIRNLFKLYPWEWILGEFGAKVLETYHAMHWIEPIWKMLWSNKGMLAILYELNPGHENLLPTYLDGPRDLQSYVRKPMLSREGANITLYRSGATALVTEGDYGEDGYVYQALAPIPEIDGNYPVIGSWYITDQGPAGVGIRESRDLITTNLSRFVPHRFTPR